MRSTTLAALHAALALAIAGAGACGDDDRPPAGGEVDAGVGAGADGGGADAGEPDGAGPGPDAGPASARIRVDATDGSVELTTAVDIDAEGSVLEVATLTDGVGTVRIDGEDIDAFVYERIEWPEIGQTLYQTLAVSPDALHVLWFYCASGNVTGMWLEGTDGPYLTSDTITGTCTETAATEPMPVTAPAVDMPWPELLDTWRVSGPAVSIEPGAAGWVELGAERLTVLPFDEVDCSAGTCTPGESWYELHSLLWDEDRERVCFAIFYLLEDSGTVRITYSITLPDLSDPAGITDLAGTWEAI